jgi:hypothetical protein
MPKRKTFPIGINCPEDEELLELMKDECKHRGTDITKTTKWLWYKWLEHELEQ